MKLINQRELERQLLHIIVGALTVFFIYIDVFDPLVLFLVVVSVSLASFLATKGNVPVYSYLVRRYDREGQVKTFPGRGVLFFFAGSLISIKLFPLDIALASIMVLSLGDSVSHIVGKHFGKIRNPLNGNSYKLLEGSVVGMFAGFFGALLFVSPAEALFASAFAMAAEAVEIEMNKKPVDDNIIVPLVAGIAILAVRFDWLMKLFNFIASFWQF